MDEFGYVCLADFGMAKFMDSNQNAQTFCGTPDYLSPDVFTGNGYDYASDWWAFGVLM